MWTKGVDVATKYDSLLSEGLKALNLEFQDGQRTQLSRYIAEIELFNPVYKLVGASGEQLIVKHILDSLSAAHAIGRLSASLPACRIADLGSGAGLPGIPLAIALPSFEFTLVERMGRRVDFLRNALLACNLHQRVTVYDRDLKEVKDSFGLITFRAFHPLYDILDLVDPILCEGGYVCAYKAQVDQVEAELEQVARQCKSRWKAEMLPLSVPNLDAQRMLCVLQKI